MNLQRLFWLLAPVLMSAWAAAQTPEEGKKPGKELKNDPMTEDLKDRKGGDFEALFLAHMIHHHQGGKDMAGLVKQRGEKAELKAMAEKMIATQTQEIEQMTGWLKAWHGKTPEDHPMPEKSMKKMEKDLAKLKETTGPSFDELFLKQMTAHHRSGVNMSEMVLEPGRTERSELKELAQKIATAQKREIDEMRAMRKR